MKYIYIRTWSTQSQCFICYELIGREAIMEFHHLYILWPQATLPVHGISSLLGHVVANLFVRHERERASHVGGGVFSLVMSKLWYVDHNFFQGCS